jgi:hypothetical protein
MEFIVLRWHMHSGSLIKILRQHGGEWNSIIQGFAPLASTSRPYRAWRLKKLPISSLNRLAIHKSFSFLAVTLKKISCVQTEVYNPVHSSLQLIFLCETSRALRQKNKKLQLFSVNSKRIGLPTSLKALKRENQKEYPPLSALCGKKEFY